MANKKITRTLLRYLTEIVVIFVGITISFMFDGWRESRNDRKEQVEFLNSLLADLTFKRDEINYEAKTAQQFIDSADRVIAAYESHKLISGNLADHMVGSYNSDNNFFSSSTPTFSLTSPNILYHQLPDSLGRKLFSLYSGFDYLKLTFEKLSLARYEYKKQLSSLGIFYAQAAQQIDGTNLKKCDCDRLIAFVLSPEFIRNMQLIRLYETQKLKILNDMKEVTARTAAGIEAYNKSI